jgi:hypothetical protein
MQCLRQARGYGSRYKKTSRRERLRLRPIMHDLAVLLEVLQHQARPDPRLLPSLRPGPPNVFEVGTPELSITTYVAGEARTLYLLTRMDGHTSTRDLEARDRYIEQLESHHAGVRTEGRVEGETVAGDVAREGVGSKPRSMGIAYSDVPTMIRCTDPELAGDFECYLSAREIVRRLVTLRCTIGISQAELATRLDCEPGKIERLESSSDARLNIGDVASYAGGLGHAPNVLFTPNNNLGASVEFHMASVTQGIEKVFELARDDPSIRAGGALLSLSAFGRLLAMSSKLTGIKNRSPVDSLLELALIASKRS